MQIFQQTKTQKPNHGSCNKNFNLQFQIRIFTYIYVVNIYVLCSN